VSLLLSALEALPVRPGHCSLQVEVVAGQSAVTSARATSPLKLLTPRSRGPSVWVYLSSFGGGLVAGDETRLDIRLGPEARCFIGTQASTKVYRNPLQRPCGHQSHAVLERGSLLVLVPDPVQAFAGSSYTQRQEFHLERGAGLVLVDWLCSGRAARGERWVFNRFHSRNDVFLGDERLLVDSTLLDPADGPLDGAHRMGRFNCLALVLLVGEPVREAAAHLLAQVATQPVTRRAAFINSASPLRDGVLLRMAGEEVETVAREIHRHLTFLVNALGDDPWARKG